MNVGMPIFVNSSQKSVTIATFLERSQRKVRLIMPTHTFTYLENFVQIARVHSEIIGVCLKIEIHEIH